MCLHQLLGRAHAQPFLDDAARKHGALSRFFDTEQNLRVTHAEQAFRDVALQLPIEREQTQRIGHRGAPLADTFRRRFLREIEIAYQTRVAVRLFDRIQSFALQILDEAEGRRGCVARFHHTGGDRFDLEQLIRAPAAFARNQLEFVAGFAHDDRLEQTFRTNALGEFAELFRRDFTACLVWARLDLHHGDFQEARRARVGCSGRRRLCRCGGR